MAREDLNTLHDFYEEVKQEPSKQTKANRMSFVPPSATATEKEQSEKQI